MRCLMKCLIAAGAGAFVGWAWATGKSEPEYPAVPPTREKDHGPLPAHGPGGIVTPFTVPTSELRNGFGGIA